MTEVVYYLQAGPDGPVKIAAATQRGLPRRITTLQAGNPELLICRALIAADALTEGALQSQHAAQHLRADWFTPRVLDDIPDDLPRVEIPFEHGHRKEALERLRERA